MTTSLDLSYQPVQPAQSLSGFDPTSTISSLEQGLLGNLGTPVQQTLAELPLQQFPGSPQLPPGTTVPPNQIDPYGLITPVINSLQSLGTGQFSGVDPTQVLSGIASAVEGNTPTLQQAMGSAANHWQGQSGTAANNATQAALANGSDVANQANGLGNIMSTAASYVAQARQQLMDIIDQYQGTVAAADPSTPAGKQAILTAANQANTAGTGLMQELQGNLGNQASQASAIGAPVGGTQTPTSGNTLLSNPMNWLMGPTGLPGAFNTVVNDPRMTPQGIAQDFMNLLFLPTTVTQLNQGIQTTNATIGQTNAIMTGLNGTIGHTNSIMGGLGNTLGTTNREMTALNQNVGPNGALVTGMTNLAGDVGPGSSLVTGMNTLSQDVGPNSALVQNTGPNGVLAQNTGPNGVLAQNTGPNGVLAKEVGPHGVLAQNTGPNGVLAQNTGPNGPLAKDTGPNSPIVKTIEPLSSAAKGAEHVGHDLWPPNWFK